MSYPRLLRVAELIRVAEPALRSSIEPLPPRVSVATAELPAGTLVTLELRRPWWDRRPRSHALAELQTVMDRARTVENTVVVAAAIRRDGRVLLAERNHPPALAGRWEFPGGKVEKGETLAAALIRECREELGVRISVNTELGRQRLPDGAELVLFRCQLAAGSSEAAPLEHRQLRWVDAAELARLALVDSNRHFVTEVTRDL